MKIAAPACGHHIFPCVNTTTGSWHHMVNRVSDLSAVLTTMIVSGEHTSARHRLDSSMWNLHHLAQSDHLGQRNSKTLRPPGLRPGFDQFGFLVEDQTYCPTHCYHAQRLKRSVKNQRAGHLKSGPIPVPAPPQISDHVLRNGPHLTGPVLGLEPELKVLSVRNRQEGRTLPPTCRPHTIPLPDRSSP